MCVDRARGLVAGARRRWLRRPRRRACSRRSPPRSSTRSASRRARGARATAACSTAPAPGTAVRAAAAGTVTFSGVVAGTRYVVVDHARRAAGDVRRPGVHASCAVGRRGRRRRRRRPRRRRRAALRAAAGRDATSTRRRSSAASSSGRASCRPTARRRAGAAAAPALPGCAAARVSAAQGARTPCSGTLLDRPTARWSTDSRHPATTCGRFGAGGGSSTAKEIRHGCHHHAADARGRCPLRTPDPALEPEDEALHLR